MHTPGHTPGNAALYFEDRLAVISGDTLITHNPLTGRTGPQVMPSGFNGDTAQALASLSALEDLNAEIILPGHGDPWHGPVSQAAQLAGPPDQADTHLRLSAFEGTPWWPDIPHCNT